MFERRELQELRERALQAANDVVNQGWKRAYEDMAQAANVLDAFMARIEEHS